MQGIFPKEFEKIVMECYSESNEAFQNMFEDAAKYKAIMTLLGELFYKDAMSKKIEYNNFGDDFILNVAEKNETYGKK